MSQPGTAELHRPVQVNKIPARAWAAHRMLCGFHTDVTASHLPLGESDQNPLLPGSHWVKPCKINQRSAQQTGVCSTKGAIHISRAQRDFSSGERRQEWVIRERGIHRQREITGKSRGRFHSRDSGEVLGVWGDREQATKEAKRS